ncbi:MULTISPECIES: hypothetical protein [unclassified Streptomyces]|uniref:hypothetical protein n=1 Tax=unclassified Streptomyces TaxID=2593676 RepID=UPI0006B216B3|nr:MULTISPECIES: hypothetical protein [unclassified Streptomyces]KOY57525.1 membrane protein [Streptomyces sp. XY332]THA39036.1 hypothetical protein E6W17_12625 [Streptomyces sp. A1547]
MSATLLGSVARTTVPQTALRRFLALDSVVTTANGLAYAAFSAPLGRLLGVGQAALLELGLFLTLYGAGVGWLASRRRPPVLAVKGVIEANCAWVALSLVSLFLWEAPTTAGLVWIPAQALTVAGFALLQRLALRQTASGPQ